jgi:apolipoprotein N-acyltransferase
MKPDRRIWACLLIALLLLPFCNGADSIPLIAWLAPVFLLHFVRRQPLRIGLPLAYLALTAAMAFQFRGMVPIPGIGYYLFLIGFGLALVLPYVVDRLLTPRLTGIAATLVFPAAYVVSEYLVSLGPYGTWGSAAYSQYGDLALLQLVSVSGLWGITFLMAWTAAVLNQVWEEGFGSGTVRATAMLCAAVVGGVILAGGIRLAAFPPASPTVRVASLTAHDLQPALDPDISFRQITNQAEPGDLPVIRSWAAAVDDDLMARTERELEAGARVVFWNEVGAFALKQDEVAFIARGAALAARYHAYLGMELNVWNPGATPPNENVLVLLGPDGNVAWRYAKSRPVPGFEAAMQVPGDGRLKFADTPYGRISGVICFDGDFPRLLAQAGAARADLVLDPASDWRAIDPWHTQMASFRAIEQGFNLVRQTRAGLSAAYDYQGRPLAAMDHFSSTDRVLVAAVPTRGVATLYARLGDWLVWVSALLLLYSIVRAALARDK